MAIQITTLKAAQKIELGDNTRLVRIIAKKGMIGNRTMESQGCILGSLSANALQLIMANDAGKEYLLNAVYSVQDGIVRKLVENGKMAIFEEQISIDAILNAMQSENESGRFSGKTIEQWFNDVMTPVLTVALNEKGYSAQCDKLLKSYKESFMILAQRNPSMSQSIKAGLIRALELLPDDAQEYAVTLEIARRLADVQEASAMLAAL